MTWCRNPLRSGFGIPLLSSGQSSNFYPDFLAWKAKNIFALDTKGEHILRKRRLPQAPGHRAKSQGEGQGPVRMISWGHWDDHPQRVSADGFTVSALGHANALKPIHCATMAEAVKTCLRPTL